MSAVRLTATRQAAGRAKITLTRDDDHETKRCVRPSIEKPLVEVKAMYNRTQNDNGTWNTRCLDCFMTIAFAVESNNDLDSVEARHICPERALAEMLAHSRTAGRLPAAERGSRL